MKSWNDVCVIIAAAGSGSRAGLGYNKLLFEFNGIPLIKVTAERFAGVKKIIIACAKEDFAVMTELFEGNNSVVITEGGATRTESIRKALLLSDGEITLIHDGARPYLSQNLISNIIEQTRLHGNAIPCVTADVAIKRANGEKIESADRTGVYFVQTPQGFSTKLIKSAYEAVEGNYADDSEVLEKFGVQNNVIEGERQNIKLTYDYQFQNYKIGHGYDVHRLTAGRKLILGGVEIPFDKGLDGHSDADVLVHAIMDAILSAIGQPDIGVLFPVDDSSLDGIDSMILLERVMERAKCYRIINLSAVVMAQKPKLMNYIPLIRKSLSSALGVDYSCVNVSATTTEKLGIVGNGEGMAAEATVLMSKIG